MKKATPTELRIMAFNDPFLYGSINHVEMSNLDLRIELFGMQDSELHYNIVGNCIFIFKPETK